MKNFQLLIVLTVLIACGTARKPHASPTDERSFTYVYNCRYYLRDEMAKLGLPIYDSMRLIHHPQFTPWADSCDAINRQSFPRYLGGAIDKRIQQMLGVDTSGVFDASTANSVKNIVAQNAKKGVTKADLYGLTEFQKGPILTEGLYRYLLQKAGN